MKAPSPDAKELELRRLSRSPYVTAVADSILQTLDREWLAELIAYYLYTGSRGEASGSGVLKFAFSRRPMQCASIVAKATPFLLLGLLADGDLRSAVASSLRSWMGGGAARKEPV